MTPPEGPVRLVAAARGRLPAGSSLEPDAWRRRHRGVLWLLALSAVGLGAFGYVMGQRPLHILLETSIVAATGALAAWPKLGRRVRSITAAFGLMTSSAILVHFSGGYIEAHFHFFVMLGVIFLYEDWLPYVLAVAYVAVHHGVVGMLAPASVYNHPGGTEYPWMFALIHAFFILGLSAALLVVWNVLEAARGRERIALTESDELKRRVLAQEKMAALGALVSGLAHEVRTPLTIVSSNAALIDSAAKRNVADLPERASRHVLEIQASVDRMNALVQQLRKFHSLQADELALVSLTDTTRDAVRLFVAASKSDRQISLDLHPMPASRLSPLGIHQIVLNLLQNAVEATDPVHARIWVRTYVEQGRAVLEVEDNGCGMEAEGRVNAFQPLYTTKRDGMGLGLHIVKRIVDAHGAEISFTSTPGRGTRFVVRFALAEGETGAFAEPARAVSQVSAERTARA